MHTPTTDNYRKIPLSAILGGYRSDKILGFSIASRSGELSALETWTSDQQPNSLHFDQAHHELSVTTRLGKSLSVFQVSTDGQLENPVRKEIVLNGSPAAQVRVKDTFVVGGHKEMITLHLNREESALIQVSQQSHPRGEMLFSLEHARLELSQPEEFDAIQASPEICDGIDNDLDGDIDDGVLQIFYRDLDLDTWGDVRYGVFACQAPSGYAPQFGDCDDTRSNVYPGATEIPDAIDNNCNGNIHY